MREDNGYRCKTIDCPKQHPNVYSAGQCSRHYGPNSKPSRVRIKTTVNDEHNDVSAADADYAFYANNPEVQWSLLNDEASDSETSSQHSFQQGNNDHFQETSEVNDFI